MVDIPLAVEIGDTEPQGGVEHDTVHVTPKFAESLLTVAINCRVPPACTVAEDGDTITLTGGGGVVRVLEEPHPNSLTARTREKQVCRSDTQFFGFMPRLSISQLQGDLRSECIQLPVPLVQ